MQRQDLPVTPRGGLTDEQWNRIYPYLSVSRRGRPFDNVLDTVNGILRILRTGSPWKELPPVYRN
jgi:transposase